MRALLVAPVAAALLLGCGGERRLDHGTVIGKVYEPERNYTIWVPIQTSQVCTKVGSATSCTPVFTQMPFFEHDGEDWKLRLRDGDRTGVAYVDRGVWERTRVGSLFDAKADHASTSDPNNSKRRKG